VKVYQEASSAYQRSLRIIKGVGGKENSMSGSATSNRHRELATETSIEAILFMVQYRNAG